MSVLSARTVVVVAVAVAVAVRVSPNDPLEVIGWRALVVVLATLGAVLLVHRTTESASTSWTPAFAGILYGCGPVLVALSLATPYDALVAATLPWIVVGALDATGWRTAAGGLWLGLAGLGSAPWAVAAVAAGVLTGLPRLHDRRAGVSRWLMVAAGASAWWVVVAVISSRTAAFDLPAAPDLGDALARTAGAPDAAPFWVTIALCWPLAVLLAAAAWRTPVRTRLGVVGLVLVASGGLVWFLTAAPLAGVPLAGAVPVPTSLAVGPVVNSDVLAAALALLGLAGLLVLAPVVGRLSEASHRGSRWPAIAASAVLIGCACVSLVISTHERAREPRFDQAIAGLSTQA